jgi:hypothetical protein
VNPRPALIHEGRDTRPRRVSGPQIVDAESRGVQQFVHSPGQMAAARDARPHRIKPALPDSVVIRRPAVLHEQELAARAKQAASLPQDLVRVRDAAQGPCGQDGIEAAALKRHVLAAAFENAELEWKVHLPRARQANEEVKLRCCCRRSLAYDFVQIVW